MKWSALNRKGNQEFDLLKTRKKWFHFQIVALLMEGISKFIWQSSWQIRRQTAIFLR